jgi:hypothetical protein
MVIKYSYYISGPLTNGILIGKLPRENFDVSVGNWECSITSCILQMNQEIDATVVGITTSLVKSWTSEINRREYEATIIGIEKVEGPINAIVVCNTFANNTFSFNQGDAFLELRFINLATKDIWAKNVVAHITLSFHKVDQ